MIQQFHFFPQIWRKPYFQKIYAPQCSLQHYLQWPRHGSNLISTDRRMDKADVYIYNEILLSHKKE